jgi:hypothetical protein
MKSERQLSEELIKIILASSDYFVGIARGVKADGTVNVAHPQGYSVSAIAATPMTSSRTVTAFRVGSQWYAFGEINTVVNESVLLFRKSKPRGEKKYPVKTIFAINDNDTTIFYLGGDRPSKKVQEIDNTIYKDGRVINTGNGNKLLLYWLYFTNDDGYIYNFKKDSKENFIRSDGILRSYHSNIWEENIIIQSNGIRKTQVEDLVLEANYTKQEREIFAPDNKTLIFSEADYTAFTVNGNKELSLCKLTATHVLELAEFVTGDVIKGTRPRWEIEETLRYDGTCRASQYVDINGTTWPLDENEEGCWSGDNYDYKSLLTETWGISSLTQTLAIDIDKYTPVMAGMSPPPYYRNYEISASGLPQSVPGTSPISSQFSNSNTSLPISGSATYEFDPELAATKNVHDPFAFSAEGTTDDGLPTDLLLVDKKKRKWVEEDYKSFPDQVTEDFAFDSDQLGYTFKQDDSFNVSDNGVTRIRTDIQYFEGLLYKKYNVYLATKLDRKETVEGKSVLMFTAKGSIEQEFKGNIEYKEGHDTGAATVEGVAERFYRPKYQTFKLTEETNIIRYKEGNTTKSLNTNDFGIIYVNKAKEVNSGLIINPTQLTSTTTDFQIIGNNINNVNRKIKNLTGLNFNPSPFNGEFIYSVKILDESTGKNEYGIIKGIASASYENNIFTLNCTVQEIKLNTLSSFSDVLIMNNGSFYNFWFRKENPVHKVNFNYYYNSQGNLVEFFDNFYLDYARDENNFGLFLNKSVLNFLPLSLTHNALLKSSELTDSWLSEIFNNIITASSKNHSTESIIKNKIYCVVKTEKNKAWIEQWDIKDNGDVKYNKVFQVDYVPLKKPNEDNNEQLTVFAHSYHP